ncbi:unnamed protein product [Moneuplotes crassus]|uniref:U6 snRNA-associated Sm-like protein LSm8 n=1 Tax=Euplotes crassus TaxID=5936 RepID=A0AAD2DBB3_EUPCR|nr:unnamed protein product [Moneuplotes crassus]
MATDFFQDIMNDVVNVITNDGRNFVGTLISYDQKMNIILTDCNERVYESKDVPVEAVKMNLYSIRGDNIATIGKIEMDIEEDIDYNQVKAEPINPTHIF